MASSESVMGDHSASTYKRVEALLPRPQPSPALSVGRSLGQLRSLKGQNLCPKPCRNRGLSDHRGSSRRKDRAILHL